MFLFFFGLSVVLKKYKKQIIEGKDFNSYLKETQKMVCLNEIEIKIICFSVFCLFFLFELINKWLITWTQGLHKLTQSPSESLE